ncbi:MAG TPA: gliding motility-associated ABC transporter substrate-binding protein GldG [Flavisolibacter sp.]|nr:gliding motility-associated ABC transporter substrate-binding protein GldG [Flavisolibacter sp.]
MKGKKTKSRLWWIGVVAALIGINLVAALFHQRFDLTEEKRFSLSKPTKDLLRGLEAPVTIDVYLTGNELPAVVRKFRNTVSDFLFETQQYAGTNLEFNFIDPFGSNDTATVRQLQDSLAMNYGLSPVVINAPDEVGDELKIKQLIHGAVVRYGDRALGVDLLQGAKSFGTEPEQLAALYNNLEAGIEYKFASAIQKITASQKPVVGYALGHGETFDARVNDAFMTIREQYAGDTINLKEVPYIPSQINALVILKPTQPFADAEKLKIDQYVMNGGKVFWMLDNMYAEFDSLYQSNGFIAFDRGLNLEDLLFTYGVRINQTLLQDMQSDKLPQVSADGQQQMLVDWPFFPILNGTDHPISKNLDGIRAMFPTTLDTVQATGIRKTVLLQSSNNSRHLNAPAKIDFEFLQIAPDQNLFRQPATPVAYLLEGKFRSLYTGRVPRATADSLKQQNRPFLSSSTGEGKMIVVSDGDIAMNQFSPSAGPLPMGMNVFTRYTFANKDFFINSLEYLVNPSNILETRSKEYTLRLLDPRRVDEQRTTWQLINIALPVLMIILFGFIYQQLRKRKYAA